MGAVLSYYSTTGLIRRLAPERPDYCAIDQLMIGKKRPAKEDLVGNISTDKQEESAGARWR